MKTCTKCKEEKPLSEFYEHNRTRCKSCLSTYALAWQTANPTNKEKRRAYGRKNYHKNKEKRQEEAKAYYQANKEKAKAYAKVYNQDPTNKANKKAYSETYNKNNKEKISVRRKYYYEANKEKLVAGVRLWLSKRTEAQKEQQRERSKNLEREKCHKDPVHRMLRNFRSSIRKYFRNKGFVKSKKTEEILGCTIQEFRDYIEAQLTGSMTLNNIHLDHIVPAVLGETEEEIIALNHYSNFRPLLPRDNQMKKDRLILDIISPENKIRYKEIIERAQKQRSR